jgi:hypothetical protein
MYVATLDVAGQDEAATDPLAQLDRPARDYTVAHVFEVSLDSEENRPVYRAVDVFVDHGSRHFQDVPGRPRLADSPQPSPLTPTAPASPANWPTISPPNTRRLVRP